MQVYKLIDQDNPFQFSFRFLSEENCLLVPYLFRVLEYLLLNILLQIKFV